MRAVPRPARRRASQLLVTAVLSPLAATVLPPSAAVAMPIADEVDLPVAVAASPGRLRIAVQPGDGVLEVLLDDDIVARAAHVSDVVVDVRYGNAHVLRLDKLLDGHRCMNLRVTLEGDGAVSVSITGVGSTVVEDATRRTLRLKLC